MAHLTKGILIYASVEDVYAVARDPMRWPEWFEGMSEIENLTGGGEVGTVAEFSYMMAGMSFPVANEVLEDTFSSEYAQWTGKIEGPLAGQHTWTYTPTEEGTQVTVDMEYTVPGKALGQLADRLVIEGMQERALVQSLENLKRLCEGG